MPHVIVPIQVWFSHKRRKDKKTQAAGGQQSSTSAPASPSSTPAPAPVAAAVSLEALASKTSPTAPAASAVTHIPLASLPSFHTLAHRPASAQTDAHQSSAPQLQLQQPSPADAQLSAPVSVSVPLDRVRPHVMPSLQPLHSYTHGYASATLPPIASLTSFQQPASLQEAPSTAGLYPPAAQPAPHVHAALQPLASRAHPVGTNLSDSSLSQAASAHKNHFQQQGMPHLQAALANTFTARQSPVSAPEQAYSQSVHSRLPPTTAAMLHGLSAQANGPAADSSPSAHRLSLPLAAGTFTVGASPAWLHQQQLQQQRSALHMPPSVVTPAYDSTPAARNQLESMHSDLDAETDDDNVVTEGLRSDLQQLIELAKQTLPVPYRTDGPQLALEFDNPPSPDNDLADPDGPAKRKRVLVDGYEMEEDGEDGMNVCCLAVHNLSKTNVWHSCG